MIRLSRANNASPASRYVRRLSPTSARTVVRLLDVAAGILAGVPTSWRRLDWASLVKDDVLRLRDALADRYAVSTVNATLTAVRGILKEACDQGLLPAHAYFGAAGVPGPSRQAPRAVPDLKPGDIRRLLDCCAAENDPIGNRDQGLLALLYGADLTYAAIVAIDIADLDIDGGVLKVRRGAAVEHYNIRNLAGRLRPWLLVRGLDAGPLMLGVDKAGRVGEQRLNAQVVYDVLAKRAKQAGVKEASVSAIRRLAKQERLRLQLAGWRDRDDRGRICSLTI